MGNIYGATFGGGVYGNGMVYQLTPSGSGWTENIIYSFQDGGDPWAGLISDEAGNLYGTTTSGGAYDNGSTVYELSPSASAWTEQILYSFEQDTDGALPGGLVLDQRGDLFGTTAVGGPNGGGTVFELTSFNGSWTFTVLYSFTGGPGPLGGVVMDASGNLYGSTVQEGAYGAGMVQTYAIRRRLDIFRSPRFHR